MLLDSPDILPSDADSERIVLGTAMTVPEQFPMLASALEPDDFSIEKHRLIFRTMGEVYARGDSPDRLAVAMRLKELGKLESVDGLTYLSSLDQDFNRVVDVDPAVRRVKDLSIRRGAIIALNKLAYDMTRTDSDAAESLSKAQKLLLECGAKQSRGGNLRTVQEIVEEAGGLDRFLGKRNEQDVILTPWPGVNRILGGISAGELVIVAARPSIGKSALAMQQAVFSSERGKTVAVFSLEMASRELLLRAVCSHAGTNSLAVRRGALTRESRDGLRDTIFRLSNQRIFMDDTANITVPAIHSACRKLAAVGKLDLVIVDYLQLLQGSGKNDNRVQEVSNISRGLKLAAKDLGCPIVALSQLSRGVEHEKRRPRLSDLRESGSIEQDADTVLFIHRESIEKPDAALIIAKQRNGPVGEVALFFRPEITKFEEIDINEAIA